MLYDLLLVAAGLGLLFAGGEGLVRGAVAIAERFGISKLLIGLVIVGFGTSTPELLVSVNAALDGASEIALGNVVGSNIANILLIIGIAAAITPVSGWDRGALREAFIATLVAVATLGLVQAEVINQLHGSVMLLALVTYLFSTYWLEKRARHASLAERIIDSEERTVALRPWSAVAYVIAGIAALVFGADLLVQGAVSIARVYGVSDAVIGLSLVAIGTSLPELATAVVAALKRQSDVVLGNVIGSNIFNILAILGITVVIQPMEVAARFREIDVPIMLGATLLLLALLFAARSIGRIFGALMLFAYGSYMAFLFMNGAV
jgi:cation:H+ antiporter